MVKSICGARIRGTSKVCQRAPMDGKKRCHLHGGLSTGPRTQQGKKKQAAAVTKHGMYAKKPTKKKVTQGKSESWKNLIEDPQELYKEIVIRLLIKLDETESPREISALSAQVMRYMREIAGKEIKKSKSHEEIKAIVKERLIKLGIKVITGGVL